MPDRVTPSVRSANMAAVRNKDTKPELAVRRALFAAGYRYRLHRCDLPGRPDIVLPRYRTVVFVHGCFWHGHDCPRGRRPTSNVEFWNSKLDRNVERDETANAVLRASGWHVATIWECSAASDIRRLVPLDPALVPSVGVAHDMDALAERLGMSDGRLRRLALGAGVRLTAREWGRRARPPRVVVTAALRDALLAWCAAPTSRDASRALAAAIYTRMDDPDIPF